MITSSMSVPQEGHEDFKFLGTSNISRQDIEQLGGSIDCIFLFFYDVSTLTKYKWGSTDLFSCKMLRDLTNSQASFRDCKICPVLTNANYYLYTCENSTSFLPV